MYLGIDVGGTKIAAALVTESGRLEHRRRELLDQSSKSSATSQLAGLIRDYSRLVTLQGIGVAVPGIADPELRTVWAPNVRGWDHFPLWAELEAQTGYPVAIESDRNAALLGECLYGSARGLRDVVFLILGTGIGAGILSGGRIIRGCRQIGGAVGWLPVEFRGRLLHFEQVASGPGIETCAQETFGIGSLRELGPLARQGHEGTSKLFEEVGEVVGRVLSVLVSTFNPQLIVIGGGVANIWELLQDSAVATMRAWAQPVAVDQVEVRVSQLGEDGGILGAVAAARPEIEGPEA